VKDCDERVRNFVKTLK